MASQPNEYIPGVCNIGNTEAKSRRRLALNFTVITICMWVLLLVVSASLLLFLVLAFPAFVAATSYIQSAEHFCAGFGAEGLYNFSDQLGNAVKSKNPSDHVKDKKKAINITIRAGVVGLIVAAFAAGTSLLIS